MAAANARHSSGRRARGTMSRWLPPRGGAAMLLAAVVGGSALADAATGSGVAFIAVRWTVAVLAVLCVVATGVSVAWRLSALPLAAGFGALAWVVALAADRSRSWVAPMAGVGLVTLLLVAAPFERTSDRGVRRSILLDRAGAIGVATVGVVGTLLLTGAAHSVTLAAGALLAVASLGALAAGGWRLLRRGMR